MFETAQLSSTEKQLDLVGGIYFVKREGDNWSLDKYKTFDSTNNKSVSSTSDTVFPKPKDSLDGLETAYKKY